MTEVALVENLQREGLDPIEEALAYQGLMDTYKQTQENDFCSPRSQSFLYRKYGSFV